jgi:hypothetical protein
MGDIIVNPGDGAGVTKYLQKAVNAYLEDHSSDSTSFKLREILGRGDVDLYLTDVKLPTHFKDGKWDGKLEFIAYNSENQCRCFQATTDNKLTITGLKKVSIKSISEETSNFMNRHLTNESRRWISHQVR